MMCLHPIQNHSQGDRKSMYAHPYSIFGWPLALLTVSL
jgi:hypothetical protein